MNYILVVRDWSNDVHKEHFEGGVRYLFKVFVKKIFTDLLSIFYIYLSIEKICDCHLSRCTYTFPHFFHKITPTMKFQRSHNIFLGKRLKSILFNAHLT